MNWCISDCCVCVGFSGYVAAMECSIDHPARPNDARFSGQPYFSLIVATTASPAPGPGALAPPCNNEQSAGSSIACTAHQLMNAGSWPRHCSAILASRWICLETREIRCSEIWARLADVHMLHTLVCRPHVCLHVKLIWEAELSSAHVRDWVPLMLWVQSVQTCPQTHCRSCTVWHSSSAHRHHPTWPSAVSWHH